MSSSFLVSVIVPVYNVEPYLRNCLDSIVNQTYKNIEIIAINDGSTDRSLEILKNYQKKDKRIIIINQENQGLSGARNSGIKAAKGEYILFVDSDDTIKKSTLEELTNYIHLNNLDIVVYGYTKLYENGKIIAQPNFGDKIIEQEDARRLSLSLKLSPMACNKIYKRELFKNNLIKFPIGFLHEDIGTTYKLFWNANKVGIVPHSYYNWYVRGDSITGSFSKKHIEDIIFLLTEKKKFLIEQGKYNKYKIEYLRSLIQIKTLLLERAIKNSTYNNNILNFLLEKLEVYNTENIDMLIKYDFKLYKKYESVFNKAQKINLVFLNNKVKIDNNYSFKDILSINKMFLNNYLNKVKLVVFPKGSLQRRTAIKLKSKIKGKING